MSLKQTYENSQPKNVNDFFVVSSVSKNKRSASKDNNFFSKLLKDRSVFS